MRRALLAMVFSWTGCASTAPPVEDEPSLELGTGTWRFESVEDGQGLPMIMGAQGGWHVWIAVRAEGVATDRGSLTIELQPADESEAPQTTSLGIQFDPPDDEGGRNYLGWPAILPDPACAAGQLYRVSASVGMSSGERMQAERYVIPTPDENPPPACAE